MKDVVYREQHHSLRRDRKSLVDVEASMNEYLEQRDWRVNANANQGYSLGGMILNTAGKVVANYLRDMAELPLARLFFPADDRESERLDATLTVLTMPGLVLTIAGPVKGVLTAERTALNFASHLSGVATATSRWVDALEGTDARVLDTRKTLPGWRALQKYAVRCGGGVNHRFSLVDRAMVKDNHAVAAGGVVAAYQAVVAANPGLRVEVEVMDLDELRAVLDAGCTEVLLDNMSNADMAEAVRINRAAGGRATLEASGGLTLERAREVGATGVDFISVGALTHSPPALDLALDFD